MKKIWIKLTKHFQGGEHTDYMLVDESVIDSKYKQDEIMADWGENSDGGHNYGYRVDMHFMEKNELPPTEWLIKEEKRLLRHLEYLKDDIKESKETIKYYHEILSKNDSN